MSLSKTDNNLVLVLRLCAFISATIVVLILVFLLKESWSILHRISVLRFINDPSWHPAQGFYNISPMLWATILSTLGALFIAIPLGIASALFCRYYASPILAIWYRHLIELLAGIPSVVYGLWGLTTIAPLIGQWHPPGVSLLTAILVLALMIMPTLALAADAALLAVPVSYYRSAAALGLSRWAMIKNIILPAAQSGISSGIILATGRAIGETMAVMMVAGNVVQFPHSLFTSVRTLTANIALEMSYAMGDHRAALFVSALALLLMVVVLFSLTEAFKQKSFYVKK